MKGENLLEWLKQGEKIQEKVVIPIPPKPTRKAQICKGLSGSIPGNTSK